MDHNEIFCESLPVIQKAAPLVATLLGSPVAGTIVGLFASLVGANACKPTEVADAMKNDPDLYAKLEKLEQTHAEWLKHQQGS